jgi:hypothetical protein
MTNTHSPSLTWRWLALISVILNIGINYYTNVNPINNQTIGDVSAQYPILFTPAGYAFSIWGLIYLSLSVYAVAQLLPSQRNVPVYDRLAGPLIVISILSIAWVIVFSYERLGLSVVIIAGMLLTAIVLFGRVKQWIFRENGSAWLTVPFSLYLGWLSVAIIANAASWLTGIGWRGGAWGETPWAVLMILVAANLGILTSLRFRDWIYPLVIVWSCVAIWVARQQENSTVALTALIAAIILALWTIVYGIRIYRRSSPQSAIG